jgi:hypothetical protein
MKYFQANPKKSRDASKPENEFDVEDNLENDSELDQGGDIDDDVSFYQGALPDQDGSDSQDNDSEPESLDDDISDMEQYELEMAESDVPVEKDEKETPRKRRKTDSLASKAKSLGYTGSFFSDAMSEFAPIEEFESFL